MTSLCGRMAGFLKALGFESKPEYAEKIPEQLTSDDVSIHEVRGRGVEREGERGEKILKEAVLWHWSDGCFRSIVGVFGVC